MKNLLVTFPCTPAYREELTAILGSRLRIVFREPDWSREVYEQELKIAHIVVGEPRNEEFHLCENLELMHSPCSGVNYYVNGGTFPQSAILCSATGCYGNVIAEHMLSLILSLCRRLPEYQIQQSQHIWQVRKYDKQLERSTVLILGAGDIGTTLARFLRPMVGRIIGIRRTCREFPDCYDEMHTLDALDSLLPQADIIACALPHTPQTIGLLNESRLRMTKPDAVLVNGGRGSLIDQTALCKLLQEGHFWGVGLDGASPEPFPSEHPLWDQPRLLLTPHASGNSFDMDSPLYHKIWKFIIENLIRYLEGEAPRNQIDFSSGYCRAEQTKEEG